MKRLALTLLVTLLPLTVEAQVPISGDLTVSLNPQRYRICNERPHRPVWAEELLIREAWKGRTLRSFYELLAWEQIVLKRDCSCRVRFPDWQAAEQAYQDTAVYLSQPQQTQLRAALSTKRQELALQVEDICKSQGNW